MIAWSLVVALGMGLLLILTTHLKWHRAVVNYWKQRAGDLQGREVYCSGCQGTGKVYYGPEHPVIKVSGDAPGEYTCPYCGGSGKLVEESE